MQHKIGFLGKQRAGKVSFYAWTIEINGEIFQYRTNISHAPHLEIVGQNWNALLDHAPDMEEFLRGLFLDADACSVPFSKFCDSMGLSIECKRSWFIYCKLIQVRNRLLIALGDEYDTVRASVIKEVSQGLYLVAA